MEDEVSKEIVVPIEKAEKMIGWGESVMLNIPIELIRPPIYGQEIKFLVNSSELYKCQDITKWFVK
mgnify:CR=1 FL=1|jgi:hypothetical protein